MSLWRLIADAARSANARYDREYSNRVDSRHREMESEQRRKNATNCCANCVYFYERGPGGLYWCAKHDFKYSLDAVKYDEIHYKRICDDFHR